MQLYEFEAKTLLTRYGIAVPRGALWPDLPSGLRFPVAVKAQALAGGRGKRGGVRKANSGEEVSAVVKVLQALTFDGEPVVGVRVEEWLSVDRESYLACMVDRDARASLLLANAGGGVEVESAAAMTRLALSLDAGPTQQDLRTLSDVFGLPVDILTPFVHSLCRAFVTEDAMLVEVNPFANLDDSIVALDARVFLDDAARFRHPDWPPPRGGTPFEQACAALGSSGVEMAGDIALITSGAGLGMASVDLLATFGGRPRAMVDLGPVVFQAPEKIAQVIDGVAALRPRALLFNFFLQLVPSDSVAKGIAAAISPYPELPVVVRLRGVRMTEARIILSATHAQIYEELRDAIQAVVRAADAGNGARPSHRDASHREGVS